MSNYTNAYEIPQYIGGTQSDATAIDPGALYIDPSSLYDYDVFQEFLKTYGIDPSLPTTDPEGFRQRLAELGFPPDSATAIASIGSVFASMINTDLATPPLLEAASSELQSIGQSVSESTQQAFADPEPAQSFVADPDPSNVIPFPGTDLSSIGNDLSSIGKNITDITGAALPASAPVVTAAPAPAPVPKKTPWGWIALGVAVSGLVLFFWLRKKKRAKRRRARS